MLIFLASLPTARSASPPELSGGLPPERLMATLASPARRSDTTLETVREKMLAGRRLSFEDGVALYKTHDLLGLGALANRVREQ